MSEQAFVHTGPPKGVRLSPAPLRSRAARGRRGREARRDWRPLWLASPVVVALAVAASLGLWSPGSEERNPARATPTEPRNPSASGPARTGTPEPQAARAFQQAQAALQLRGAESNAEARRLYEEAIRLDPSFARAYAGLAMTYALEQQHGWGQVNDGGATLQRAAELAAQAVRLQPALPKARWALAYVYSFQRRHAEALRELEEALRLDPGYADAVALQGAIHLYLGEPARTVSLARQEATSLYLLLLGRAYFFLGDTTQARQHVAQSLQRNPQNLEARLYMAALEHDAGRAEAAQWQVAEILQLEPDLRADDWLANYPLVDPDSRDRLRRALLALGL